MNNKKIKVGVLGATGMIGQKFVALLENHPFFEVVVLAASARSAGKTYKEEMKDRWIISDEIPSYIENIVIEEVEKDKRKISRKVDLVFSAMNMDSEKIREIELYYAQKGIGVISNNSAHRWTEDVAMILPEVNEHHTELIDIQRKNRGWQKGFIVTKSNCSIQSYVSVLKILKDLDPYEVIVTSMQAISGAGKNFDSWPEMVDNIIPYIEKEEEKSEKEPLKIFGDIVDGKIKLSNLKISATCVRVPVLDGHMANVRVNFKKNTSKEEIIHKIENFKNPIEKYNLPSHPKEFVKYLEQPNRPQIQLDKNFEGGMGITMGRLQEDDIMDFKFISLAHNTVRGAAGGAILLAELLVAKGYLN